MVRVLFVRPTEMFILQIDFEEENWEPLVLAQSVLLMGMPFSGVVLAI